MENEIGSVRNAECPVPLALTLMLHATLIDELGFLSYNNRHADLLFEVVNRRYEAKPNIIPTAPLVNGERCSLTYRVLSRSLTG